MHRSRASDEFFKGSSSPSPPPPARPTAAEFDQLPTYDPESDIGKKEAINMRFAQNTVHLIPLVLILCAAVLWFFSTPHIGMVSKEDSVVMAGKAIDGNNNLTNHSSAVTGGEVNNLDSTEDTEKKEYPRSFKKRYL